MVVRRVVAFDHLVGAVAAARASVCHSWLVLSALPFSIAVMNGVSVGVMSWMTSVRSSRRPTTP
jgi:hypothetical protein